MENEKSNYQRKNDHFKTLALSKLAHLSLVTNFPTEVINERNEIQQKFICRCNNPKIKHTTLYRNYESIGLKN